MFLYAFLAAEVVFLDNRQMSLGHIDRAATIRAALNETNANWSDWDACHQFFALAPEAA
ncbi:hypothetical protein P0D73_15840 [Paraburkholderia sp. RL18-101-BIB-B]|uniref:hypothetical protein n=1 Tax=Paraburkholderia sp. RL18-101-BIB-B TaxID=3031634 RepID=UPI0038BD159F